MELFFCQPDQISEDLITLDKFEQKHIVQTLRKKTGDKLILTDGIGHKFHTNILQIKPDLLLKINNTETMPLAKPQISLAVGFIRSNRLDWLLEKALELGVYKIYLVKMQYSPYSSQNSNRLQKILRQALKQSLQYHLPEIVFCESISHLVEMSQTNHHRYFALSKEEPGILKRLIDSNITVDQNILITIGPEGGFHEDETAALQKAGFIPLSLGQTRLRTETAAINALSGIHAYMEKLKEEKLGTR